MGEPCVSSARTAHMVAWCFSVAARAEALDKDEECATRAGRDWSYSSKFGHTNPLQSLPYFESGGIVIDRVLRIGVEMVIRDRCLTV
jgi:hypothetical protein